MPWERERFLLSLKLCRQAAPQSAMLATEGGRRRSGFDFWSVSAQEHIDRAGHQGLQIDLRGGQNAPHARLKPFGLA